MKLDYDGYCKYYARRCTRCSGERRVKNDKGRFVSCGCQYIASVKFRYDKIRIFPEALKYKKWSDFTGTNKYGKVLTEESFLEAKQKALQYCFGSAGIKGPSDRRSHLKVHKHRIDGRNVIIAGGHGSGKSLIASLILKELVYASVIFGTDITFEWVKADSIIDAARWDNNKAIDRDRLDFWASVDFLFVDGIDVRREQGDHRQAPDMACVNMMFYERSLDNKPTIMICSDDFYSRVSKYPNDIKSYWGEEILSMVMDSRNELILLKKEAKHA